MILIKSSDESVLGQFLQNRFSVAGTEYLSTYFNNLSKLKNFQNKIIFVLILILKHLEKYNNQNKLALNERLYLQDLTVAT